MAEPIKLEIKRPDGQANVFDIVTGVYTIGRDEDCKIQLPHPAIEGRHAILTVRVDGCWIEDLDSAAGTTVSGKKIDGRVMVGANQAIGIGPFTLSFLSDKMPPASVENKAAPAVEKAPPAREETRPHQLTMEPADIEAKRSIKLQIHRELVERLDVKRLTASRIGKDELHERAKTTIRGIVNEVRSKLPAGMDPEALMKELYDEAIGLGPIEDLLDDPEVTEVMVNGPSHIYIEKKGKLILTGNTFIDEASVMAIIERIVSPIGRRIDESQPYVDARLPDGSRVNAIIHPLSLVGPCLTIRKFSKKPLTVQDLIRYGTITPELAEFARVCVIMRKNIIVSGGTGSGKTTLLNVLSNYLPETERIVTIEDAAELRLKQVHVVRLESRPPNIEGKGAVTIRDLVRNALRMRPDRIVVGECRGGESLDMLQAMNTGHDGSLTTVHANSPRDVISRLETMVLMSGMELPVRAIREQVASAVDVIVHESRFSDGTRKVSKMTEVVGLEGEQITMQDIFEYKQTGVDPDGKVIGHFHPTGAVPTFIEEIAARGISIDRSIFDPQKWKE